MDDKHKAAHNSFLYGFAYMWSLSSIIYIFCVSFVAIPVSNVRVVDTIVGFLLGTIIAGLIGYFYGASHTADAPPAKPPAPPTPPVAPTPPVVTPPKDSCVQPN